MSKEHNLAACNKRKQKDKTKLLMSDYILHDTQMTKHNPFDFLVEFEGPKDSLYYGGKWLIHVILPD